MDRTETRMRNDAGIGTTDGPSTHRKAVAAYVRAGLHLTAPSRAKSVRVIAAELGMSATTARRWLRRDHYDQWMEYWPTVEDIFAESERERQNRQPAPASTILQSLPSPEALEAEFDPVEEELMNAQRYAAYRHHRRGQR